MIGQLKKIIAVALFFLTMGISSAYAIPSFARQTGLECVQCHTVFPELTATGRWFKLNGYTMTKSEKVNPFENLSGMVLASYTQNANTTNGTIDLIDPTKDRRGSLDQVSLFYGGKIIDNMGAFIQMTYDGTDLKNTKDVAHHISSDNADIRYVKEFKMGSDTLITGLTLNNNPGVQDVYNTIPVWSFPFASSANMNSLPSTMVEGGLSQQVAGLGIYAMYNDTIYAEISAYKSNSSGGLLSALSYNKFSSFANNNTRVKDTTIYSRIALQKTVGDNFFMVGGYTLDAKLDPDITTPNNGQYNSYSDRAIDAQYSYTSGSNMITANATMIREKQTLNNTFAALGSSNNNNSLTTSKAKISYYYNQKYGATAGVFSAYGSQDNTLYGNSQMGSPNGAGKIVEFDYLPIQQAKISLQYTMFDKYNGAKTDYDAQGRHAKDNNNLFLSAWIMF